VANEVLPDEVRSTVCGVTSNGEVVSAPGIATVFHADAAVCVTDTVLPSVPSACRHAA
jgi:hypothetical protein